MGDRYECDRCGACCRQYVVYATPSDLAREPSLAGVTRRVGLRRVEHEIRPPAGRSLGCCLLGPDNLCPIYETRPGTCSSFRAGSEQCQEARELERLPPLAPASN